MFLTDWKVVEMAWGALRSHDGREHGSATRRGGKTPGARSGRLGLWGNYGKVIAYRPWVAYVPCGLGFPCRVYNRFESLSLPVVEQALKRPAS